MTAMRDEDAFDISLSRRDFAKASAGVATVGLAGCSGFADEGQGSATATASFFAVYDLTEQVLTDTQTVVDLVPVGSHGDDWKPDPDVIQDITESDVFVYLDGFRSWSDRQARNVREDYEDVTVVDVAEGIDFIEGEGGRERDPHFWLDPTLAGEAVDTIADGFAEAFPDHEDEYRENAEAYKERLQEVDERFETELENRDHDLVVMGNHNSFSYWEPRYGFEIRSATGLSPDDGVSAQDREEIEATMEELGIEHVAHDMYESDRVTERIASSTGAETVPLSPIEATTDEQYEEGMGYVEHMLEINLSSLRRALGAE